LNAPYKLQLALLELANRSQELTDTRRLARAALAWKVGLAEDAPFTLAEDRLSEVRAEVPSVDSLWQMALVHRPDWQRLRAGIAARSAQEEAARRAYYPQIFLAGGVRYAAAPGRTDQRNPFVKDDYNLFNGAVVLGLRQSFEWGLLGADVDRARAQRRQLEAQRSSAGQGIRLEIEQALGDYRRAVDNRERAREGRNLVREWVGIARDEYELDTSQIKELVSAFEALAASEEAWYRSLYAANVALAELERVVGTSLRAEGETE
jgi:outer membrane protein TolC